MKKFFILFILIISCSYPKLSSDIVVYENDFENQLLANIDGGNISKYNNTNVLGDFNNDSFILHLSNLESHEFIFVAFDLYVHGSWDGNFNGFDEEKSGFKDQPDIWGMELNPDMPYLTNMVFKKFETTFSNSPCFSDYCLKQSYPNNFPFINNPMTGSAISFLPEHCTSLDQNNVKTTLYKIEISFAHKDNALILKFYDKLFQPNAIDKNGNNIAKCDESWSLDNLKIRAVKYD